MLTISSYRRIGFVCIDLGSDCQAGLQNCIDKHAVSCGALVLGGSTGSISSHLIVTYLNLKSFSGYKDAVGHTINDIWHMYRFVLCCFGWRATFLHIVTALIELHCVH